MTTTQNDISKIYEENLKFWDEAWKRVSKPHKELPKLPYIHEITRKLKKYQVKKVLDLGCGSGWLSIFISKYGFDVTGIDIAKPAVELGKTWASEDNAKVNFLVGDLLNLPFKENSFDAVVCNSVLEHFRFDQAKVLFEKVHKILTEKGFLFACFDQVGSGKGEYFELSDSTHVYTDQMRQGMMLRNYSDNELKELLSNFDILSFDKNNYGSRLVWARKK
ncbi:MAG: class I SAM-dependent methyltransferase [Candidatus Melainabacteria bacterium]|nr:class I SAM-dependent methyltransferase [Candidatus Melainabacteria bacterium]